MTARPAGERRARARGGPGASTRARFRSGCAAAARRRLPRYELPMGLLGFPGVGWLFAGFPFTASILLLGGPGAHVGGDPARVLPVRRRAAAGHRLAGRVRLAAGRARCCPRRCSTARTGAGACGLRQRRPRRAAREPARTGTRVGGRGSGRSRSCSSRSRSCPRSPGVGSSPCATRYEPRLTQEITGQFLATPRGPGEAVRLAGPAERRIPHDALRVHARDVGALLVRAAAVDAPAATSSSTSTAAAACRSRSRALAPRSLTLAPARPLRPGRYLFVATHEGMFGGRDFVYLRSSAPGAAVTPIGAGARAAPAGRATRSSRSRPRSSRALFALLLLRSCRRRPAGRSCSGRRLRRSSRSPPRARRSPSGSAGARRSSAPTTWRAAC